MRIRLLTDVLELHLLQYSNDITPSNRRQPYSPCPKTIALPGCYPSWHINVNPSYRRI